MVRLLGHVDVVNRDGTSATPDRGQPVELLAWLSTRRTSTTRIEATDALWAGRSVDPRLLRNILSAARRLLRSVAGEPPDGEEWITTRRRQLDLHALVVTDVALLRDRIAYATCSETREAEAVLASGLDLLRGVPFDGARWLWVDERYLTASMGADAADLAAYLTSLRLGLGDSTGALAAADIGLRVVPLHERLTELVIRAWMARDDRRAALAAYEAYCRAVSARGEASVTEMARLRGVISSEEHPIPRLRASAF